MQLARTIVLKDADQVDARLSDMGLDMDVMRNAALAYSAAEAGATAFHPRNAGGMLGWMAGTATLREPLVLRDWQLDDDRGSPSTVRGDGLLRVAIVTGNNLTGSPYDVQPRTKNAKGEVTEELVDQNEGQLDLGSVITRQEPKAAKSPKTDTKCLVYLLLVNCTKDEVRYELSCPSRFENGNIIRWSERIVFPPIARQTPHDNVRYTDTESGSEAIDIDVARRGAL